MSQPYRYAIYFCPKPDSPLGRFGSDWLADDKHLAVTRTPRRYGFHATLKPPFRLVRHATPDQLLEAVSVLASSISPVGLEGFAIKSIGSFIAIVPSVTPTRLSELGAACVSELDTFRASPDSAELARRRKANLTPSQDQLLKKWGYPYVMDEFRFHLTLTEKLEAPSRERLLPMLNDRAADALGPYYIDDICVVIEPAPGAAFELLRRFPLGGRYGIDKAVDGVCQ